MATQTGRSNNKGLVVVVGIVLVVLTIVVLAILFAPVRNPKLRLGSVEVKALNVNSNSSNPSFNVKIEAQVTVKNTNFGPYKFEKSTATVSYGGRVVGEATIEKSKAKARTTKKFDVNFSLHSNKVTPKDHLRSDLSSKTLTFTAHAKLTGKVHRLRIFKRRKSAEMNCTFKVDTKAKTVNDLACK